MFIFSKSFGYSLRGILFVALRETHTPVQLDEMAESLGVPRHFMGKIMKQLVKQGILSSLKGPTG
ncbi:MAG TPA: Rrf2 family transcriptional regulator, partial [Flavisolibacter sp.]|nr:Rrf2 family transcriptional regulator [Flavisolibacter sp.]